MHNHLFRYGIQTLNLYSRVNVVATLFYCNELCTVVLVCQSAVWGQRQRQLKPSGLPLCKFIVHCLPSVDIQTCGANQTTGFKGSRQPEGVFSPILWCYEEGTGCICSSSETSLGLH